MPSEFYCLKRGRRVDFTAGKFDPSLSLDDAEVFRAEMEVHGHIISPQYEQQRRGGEIVRSGLAGFMLYSYATAHEGHESTDQLLELLTQKGLEQVLPPAIFGTEVAG
jgi:hypothetical protein